MFKKRKLTIVSAIVATGLTVMSHPAIVYGASAGQVEAKLQNAGDIVQGILTGLVVLVGTVVGLFIIIKRMPAADNPHEKNEVYQAVGRVAGLVALAAAIIWLLPWVYSLFV
ncbi:CagC family type IV secretion system protein [Carnobacterium inhibens]|uniref:CagC family type IV secretion system protein n=1 Tax=Carnobacterium inhibens TaxID=147709 RepID=UPI000553ECA2|nr:CagC family type IV secretion system protein [Carnobacterium inhibens]